VAGVSTAEEEKNLSVQFVAMVKEVRQHLNQTGHTQKRLSVVADGSFCNRTVLAEDWSQDNVSLTARCRKDIVLCKRAPGTAAVSTGKRSSARSKSGGAIRWPLADGHDFSRGCFRLVRYKELPQVYWQGAAKKRVLRLLVVAPVGYRTSKTAASIIGRPPIC